MSATKTTTTAAAPSSSSPATASVTSGERDTKLASSSLADTVAVKTPKRKTTGAPSSKTAAAAIGDGSSISKGRGGSSGSSAKSSRGSKRKKKTLRNNNEKDDGEEAAAEGEIEDNENEEEEDEIEETPIFLASAEIVGAVSHRNSLLLGSNEENGSSEESSNGSSSNKNNNNKTINTIEKASSSLIRSPISPIESKRFSLSPSLDLIASTSDDSDSSPFSCAKKLFSPDQDSPTFAPPNNRDSSISMMPLPQRTNLPSPPSTPSKQRRFAPPPAPLLSNRYSAHSHVNTDMSRYHSEFEEISKIGSGQFGDVFKCRNRLDGTVYAIKRSKKLISGIKDEKNVMREVVAHANLSRLGVHNHIVRYFSVWKEEGHLYIQNEYCDGGCLTVGKHYTEDELCNILRQITKGLKFIHTHRYAHLDIKPGNILISIGEDNQPLYKIGDFGHMTSLDTDPSRAIDGDCRYMAPELLDDDHSNLPLVDMYALGCTIFELASQTPLTKNGSEWQALRYNLVPPLPQYSEELNDLIKTLLQRNAVDRLTSEQLLNHRLLANRRKSGTVSNSATAVAILPPRSSPRSKRKKLLRSNTVA